MTTNSIPCIDQIKRIVLSPRSAFPQSADADLKNMVYFLSAVLLINFLIFCSSRIISALVSKNMSVLPIFTVNLFTTYLILIFCVAIFLLISGLWLHIWIYIFGGRKSVIQTIKAVVYSSTPGILFFWVPFVAVSFFPDEYISVLNTNPGIFWISLIFIFGIWGCFILITGITEQNGFSWILSVIIVGCSIVIPIIVFYHIIMTPRQIAFGFAFPRFP